MKLPLSLMCLCMAVVSMLGAQTKLVDGVVYPKDYRLMQAKADTPQLSKTSSDTARHGSLPAIKEDFVVSSACGLYGADQRLIAITGGADGTFMCVWIDDRAGVPAVNGQVFDREGNRMGPVMHLSEFLGAFVSDPHLVYHAPSKEYIVLWSENGNDLIFQRCTGAGEKIGHNIRVQQPISVYNPSAVADSSGTIIVTWVGYPGSCAGGTPYCRAFSAECVPLGDPWPLVPPCNSIISSLGWDDRIAADSCGRAAVVWSIRINGRSRIVIQPVNRSGNLSSEPTIASEMADSTDHIFPTITSTKDGHFLILWSSNAGIYGRVYHPDSGFVTPQLTFSSYPTPYYATYGASSDGEKKFFIAWTMGHLYGMSLSLQGKAADSPAMLPYDVDFSWGYYPRLSNAAKGRFYLAYGGGNRMQQDVVVQPYDLSFKPIASVQKAADDECSAGQSAPAVKYNQSGRALVVWEDTRDGYNDLYGQVFDESGNSLASDFMINHRLLQWNTGADITADNNGNFLVAFAGGDENLSHMYIRKISPEGAYLTGPIRLGDDRLYDKERPATVVRTNREGDVLVCWTGTNKSSVYCSRLNSELSSLNPSAPVFNPGGLPLKYIVGLSANEQFNILVMWFDYSYDPPYTPGFILKAMVLTDEGKILRNTMVVATIRDGSTYPWGRCSIDESNNLCFAWTDMTDYQHPKILIKRMYGAENVSLTDTLAIDASYSDFHVIRFDNKKLFFAWETSPGIHSVLLDDNGLSKTRLDLKSHGAGAVFPQNSHIFSADIGGDHLFIADQRMQRPERGYDIYGEIQRIDRFDFQPEASVTENLSEAYPNPSAHTVTLEYAFKQESRISVGVYNILGQRIAEIERGVKPAGRYTARFSTEGLAAGVYFFVFNGATTISKKFIVVK